MKAGKVPESIPKPSWWQPALIFVLAIGVYANTLSGDFIWDDNKFIVENRHIRNLSNLPDFFTTTVSGEKEKIATYYRPLFNVSTAVDYAIWGLNPLGFHITNMLLHALTSLLVFLVAKRLLKDGMGPFLASIIFALHPAHAEAVSWISARVHLLGAVFALLSLYLYIGFRAEGRKNTWLFLSITVFFLSVLSIGIAVLLPLVIVLYEAMFETRHPRLRYALYYAIPLIIYFLVKKAMVPGFTMEMNTIGFMDRLLTAPVIMMKYLFLFIFPFNVKVGYDIVPASSLADVSFLFYVLAVSGIFFIIPIYFFRLRRPLVFGILFFSLTILPVLNIAKQIHPMLMAGRNLYIPSIGLSIAVAGLAGGLLSKVHLRYASAVIASIAVLLSITTFRENRKWNNNLVLFEEMTSNSPASPFAHFHLANAYVGLNRYGEAKAEYEKALKLRRKTDFLPPPEDIYNGLAFIYYEGHWLDGSMEMAQAALGYNPGSAMAHFILGEIHDYRDILDRALPEYMEAVRLDSDFPEAHFRLGLIYAKKRRIAKATEEFTIAVSQRPDYIEARHNLALAYLIQGDIGSAVREYEALRKLDPGLADRIQPVIENAVESKR